MSILAVISANSQAGVYSCYTSLLYSGSSTQMQYLILDFWDPIQSIPCKFCDDQNRPRQQVSHATLHQLRISKGTDRQGAEMPQMRYRFATNIVHSLHAESMTMIRARYAMCMGQKCVLTFCLGNENQYPNFVTAEENYTNCTRFRNHKAVLNQQAELPTLYLATSCRNKSFCGETNCSLLFRYKNSESFPLGGFQTFSLAYHYMQFKNFHVPPLYFVFK